MGFWPVVKKVVYESDIILLILDARMPELSRNKALERILEINNKEFIVVFNKIDLVSEEYLNKVRDENKQAFFVSGTNNIGISRLKTAIMILAKRKGIEYPRIGVVGYPNVGKSAIINAIAKRARTKISKHAGTTKGIQWVKAGSLYILDSPGVIPFEDRETLLGVIGAKDPEKIKNVYKVAVEIVRMLFNYNRKILEDEYKIEIGEDYWDVFEQIGKKRGFLLKGGVIDENRTSMQIVRDWQRGKLKL